MRRARLVALAALLAAMIPSGATAFAAVNAGPAVIPFGDAQAPGSPSSLSLHRPVVGMAATPDGRGYWLVASDGGIFSFGDARFFGSTGGIALHRPVVGMAATPDGRGYWLVASDGGIFSFGDAGFFGSTGGIALHQPVVGLAATPDGRGYWLVASDGGIFSFGDAGFFGSTGGIALHQPVVGLAATPDGRGYWLVASDGGIFSFGDAGFFGSSTSPGRQGQPVAGIAPTPTGRGYWIVTGDGQVFRFGNAAYYGSALGRMGAGRVAASIIASPSGRGYSILATTESVRVGFAGDVNGIGRVAAYMSQGGDPLAGMRPDFALNYANIVNLETSVGSGGQAANKQYTFESPPVLLSWLKAAGVSVVSLANNHSLDFGTGVLLQTISDAHAAGLLTVGAGANSAQAYAAAIVDTPGGSVAFLGLSQVVPAGWAASPNQPGVASAYDLPTAIAAVRAARQRADYVVVMIHAGIELDQCPTADQVSLVHALLNAGANAVVGAHPHFLQGLGRIGSAVVDYSMGNFVWYSSGPQTNVTGLLSVDLGPSGASYKFDPAYIDANGSPQPLYGQAASSVVAHVTSAFPGAGGGC